MKKGIMIVGIKQARGFTLFELFAVLMIAAVLVTWGLPSVVQSIQNNAVASQNLSLMSMINLTKSESIRRNQSVTMSVEPNEHGGWDAFIEDPNNDAEVEGCQPGQLRCSSNTDASVEMCDVDGDCSSTFTLAFNNRGYLDPAAPGVWEARTIYLQHNACSGQSQRTRIDILPTGQFDSCRLACDTTDCP